MGADMIATLIWAKEDHTPDLTIMLSQVKQHLSDNRSDCELLERVTEYALGEDISFHPLYSELLAADDEYFSSWSENVLSAYQAKGEEVISSFNSRETGQIRLPGVIGYLTGGLSFGDSPTEAFGIWSNFFYDDEYGNPLGDLCYKALGFLYPEGKVEDETGELLVSFKPS